MAVAVGGGEEPTWPFVVVPKYEMYAKDFQTLSRAEFVGFGHVVPHSMREEFETFLWDTTPAYIQESHMIRYGNLDRLDQNVSFAWPTLYERTTEGGFVKAANRDQYIPAPIISPPPRTYGIPIGYDLDSDPEYTHVMGLAKESKVDSIYTKFRNYAAVQDDEHAGYHTNDLVDNPHAFVKHAVHKYPGDPESETVAFLSAALAFDASLINLLPDNVKGMHCVIKNNCNQTVTYRVVGPYAHFEGYLDTHDTGYDDLEVHTFLTQYQNEELVDTPGHCVYTMVRHLCFFLNTILAWFYLCLTSSFEFLSPRYTSPYIPPRLLKMTTRRVHRRFLQPSLLEPLSWLASRT